MIIFNHVCIEVTFSLRPRSNDWRQVNILFTQFLFTLVDKSVFSGSENASFPHRFRIVVGSFSNKWEKSFQFFMPCEKLPARKCKQSV